ncbi:MAG: zinc ribbon domain-containing protein [Desulfobacteraceae bacterium]|nr:zinc ribbon domain-containing protein [Desulfobacteraceae bacterium]
MPIYEFECKKCGHKFERLILPSDDKNPECPQCKDTNVQKLMSAGCNVTLKVPAGYGGGGSCVPRG